MKNSERLKEIETQIKIEYVYMTNVIWMFERVKKLTEALDEITIHNGNSINGIVRGFLADAEFDMRKSQDVARKALEDQ